MAGLRLLQNCQLSDYSLYRIESHLGFQLFKHPLVCYITCEHYIYLTDNISVELLGKKKDHKKSVPLTRKGNLVSSRLFNLS